MRLAMTFIAAMLLSASACAQTAVREISEMLRGRHAEVGVAWIADGRGHVVNVHDGYPLMSVFKLHVAIAALRQMERRGTPADTLITVKASEMLENTYSPMLRLYGKRDFTIRLDSLLRYSVAESDNNACDIIIRLAGGIEGVNAEMRAIRLTGFNLTETEASMHADPMRSYNNRSTPLSVAVLFKKLYEDGILGEPYRHDARTQDGHRLRSSRRHAHCRQRRRRDNPARRPADIHSRAGKRLQAGRGRQRKAHEGDCGGGD